MTMEHGSAPLYPELATHVARLDARPTRYQFTLDDLPWSRIGEAGLYLPPSLATLFGADVDALRSVPGAWETFQWAAALGTAEYFVELEQAVLDFLANEGSRLGCEKHRSLHLLGEEEAKHIAMFRRYVTHLRAQRPEWVDAYDEHYRIIVRLRDVARAEGRASETTTGYERAHHYLSWAKTLFFEEYTIWYYDRLREDAPRVQPTWLAIHWAHAREEAQHVLTDHAWLAALDASDMERRAWSKALFRELVQPLEQHFDAQLALCAALYPDLGGLPKRPLAQPFLFQLLSDRALRRTREAAPYIADLVQGGLRLPSQALGQTGAAAPAETAQATPLPDTQAILAWIWHWLKQQGKVTAGLTPTVAFGDLGVDSVDALCLAGEMENWLGFRLPATIAYDFPTVGGVAHYVAGLLGGSHPAADEGLENASATRASIASPSERQSRLARLDEAYPGRVLDHITTVYAVSGAIDIGAWQSAWVALVERHESLRTTFERTASELTLRVSPAEAIRDALRWQIVDVANGALLDEARARAAVADTTPFDLEKGPLVRAILIRGGPANHAIVLSLHHIVTDGWSMAVLMADFVALYAAHLSPPGMAPELPALTLTPSAVAAHEARLLESPEGARRLAAFERRLKSHPNIARPGRPPEYRGGFLRRIAAPAVRERYQRFADAQGATLFATLVGAVAMVERQMSGDDDIIIATHLFDRPSLELRRMVGYLVNVLPLRLRVSAGDDLGIVTASARDEWLWCVAHEVSIDRLVAELRPDAVASRWMPANVAFNLLPWAYSPLEAGGVRFDRATEALPTPSFLFFDRMLIAQEEPEGLAFTLWYDCEAVAARDAEAFIDGVLGVLDTELVCTNSSG